MNVRMLFIGIGILLILIGLLWPLIQQVGLGRLPGDILIRGKRATFYFPWMTSLIISLVLSLLLWLLRHFTK